MLMQYCIHKQTHKNIKFIVLNKWFCFHGNTKIVSEYDQEIPQSQTADNPMAPRGRAAQPSRDTRSILMYLKISEILTYFVARQRMQSVFT